MKKLFLISVLSLLFSIVVFAPVNMFLAIPIPEPIKDTPDRGKWLEAIVYVESGMAGNTAVNKYEPLAKGILQQYPIFVRDVNRILGYERYTLDDRKDSHKAKEMFWIYQSYYNPEMNFEKMCRIQCGGPTGYTKESSIAYFKKASLRLST